MLITITDNGYKAAINTMGAELKSYQDPSGKEYIWTSDPAFWFRSSPLLFPTIGNVRNGKTFFDGKEYPMDRHGFTKDTEFQVYEQTENTVTFSLCANEDTLKSYPFNFELRLTYALSGNKLAMTYQVFNNDTKEMIYHIGAHPGFNCPLEENESLTDYVVEFDEEETLKSLIFDLEHMCFFADKYLEHGDKGTIVPLYPEMFDNDALYFYHTNSRGAALKNPKTGKGIHVAYPDFVSLGLWSAIGGKAPYVCLEPWNGSGIFEDEDDNFASKRDILKLDAGKSAVYNMVISIL